MALHMVFHLHRLTEDPASLFELRRAGRFALPAALHRRVTNKFRKRKGVDCGLCMGYHVRRLKGAKCIREFLQRYSRSLSHRHCFRRIAASVSPLIWETGHLSNRFKLCPAQTSRNAFRSWQSAHCPPSNRPRLRKASRGLCPIESSTPARYAAPRRNTSNLQLLRLQRRAGRLDKTRAGVGRPPPTLATRAWQPSLRRKKTQPRGIQAT